MAQWQQERVTAGSTVPAFDWSVGHYERTAAQLLPAAEVVVERAALRPGERVVDVGCGTGNAALLAADRGARVTGVDPALRLLEVARAEAAARGVEADFIEGDAASLPLPDDSADAVLSVFAVIFAPDPQAAAAELARVAAPKGRIVLSAWIPAGAVSEVNRLARQAVMHAVGAPAEQPPFPWHNRDALERLFAPYGFAVTLEQHTLSFTAASARAYLDAEWQNHPLAVAGRRILERDHRADELRAQLLAILEAANEDRDAFCVTSNYVVASAQRG